MKQTQIFDVATLDLHTLQQIAQAVNQGAVAVLPTDTVYGIATGAFCEQGIEQICQIKKRPTYQPLQLLMADVAQAMQVAQFSEGAMRLAKAYWPGALTLILPPTEKGKALLRQSPGVGIRVPKMDFLQKFLTQLKGPLACTSANEHQQPVLTREEDLVKLFNGKVDFILKGGVLSPIASSIVDFMQSPRLLREGSIARKDLERVLGQSLTY